jgi:general stress protein 26
MAHEEDHRKSPAELQDRVWHLADKIKFCLFTTHDGERHRMRPLTAMPDRQEGAIYFLVGREGGHTLAHDTGQPVPGLIEQIDADPEVTLGFADTGASDYLIVTGHAAVSNDRAKIHELFSPFMKAWWDSENDPEIRLLTVTPRDAELWEGPNRLVAGAIMLTAAVTGAKPPVGDHGAVRM